MDKLPLSLIVSDTPIGASRTTEVKKLGEEFVLKELRKVEDLKRVEGETESQYRSRRLYRSLEILREERQLAGVAGEFIPEEVAVPEESFFIADGSDGFPSPYKVQPLINGETLRKVGSDNISEGVKRVMDKLVKASMRCYLKTGMVFDIVGCAAGDSKNSVSDVLHHLNPIKYSSNIMLLDDLKLVFVDARVGGGNLLVQTISFMTLAGYYWNRLFEKVSKVNHQSYSKDKAVESF